MAKRRWSKVLPVFVMICPVCDDAIGVDLHEGWRGWMQFRCNVCATRGPKVPSAGNRLSTYRAAVNGWNMLGNRQR